MKIIKEIKQSRKRGKAYKAISEAYKANNLKLSLNGKTS